MPNRPWKAGCFRTDEADNGFIAASDVEEVDMLGKINATANIAVKDLAVAKKFYEGTLGLTQVDAEGDEVIVMKSGDTLINVYRSQLPAPTRPPP